MTNRQLWKFYQDSKQATFCNFLNQSKIRDFYKEYGIRIDTLAKKMVDLQEKFYESKGFSDKGTLELVMEEVENDGKKSMRPKLREGMTDEEFQKEFKELMDQNIIANSIKVVKHANV